MDWQIPLFWRFVIVTAITFALHGVALMLALAIDLRIGMTFVAVVDGPVIWLFVRHGGLPDIVPLWFVIAASIFWGFVITATIEWWPLAQNAWRWLMGKSPPPKNPQI